jgi:allantoinase
MMVSAMGRLRGTAAPGVPAQEGIAGAALIRLVMGPASGGHTARSSSTPRRCWLSSVSPWSMGKVFWAPRVVFGGDRLDYMVDRGTVLVDRRGMIVGCFPGESREDALARMTDDAPATRSGREFIDLSAMVPPPSSLPTTAATASSSTPCLSPGLIDVHTHISSLGRDWEGYTTATQAAAAGGVTTVIGMPLNSLPPTCSVAEVEQELEEARASELFVDVGLWGGVLPETADLTEQLSDLLGHPNVLGLKAFLSPLPAGAGYQAISPVQLLEVAKVCGSFDKPILVHSELMTLDEASEEARRAYDSSGSSSPLLDNSHHAHVQSRPTKWEQDAVRVVVEATQHCDMHIVHLSDGLGCLPIIEEAKQVARESGDETTHFGLAHSQKQGWHEQRRRRRRLTVETCPHYLLLDSSQIRDGDTTVKCFPPIRGPEQRRELWRGLSTGLIDMIASDHSPCEPSMRRRAMRDAWGGLSGLQYQLPATWTAAQRANEENGAIGADEARLALWWSSNPARMAGLDDRGNIEPGKRADFVGWDTSHVGIPSGYSREYHRWKGDCFYSSQELQGRVLGTWLSGTLVYDGIHDSFGPDLGNYICR